MDILARLAGADGACLLGTWVKLPTLETLEMLGHAGFDFVVIDMEHGVHSHESVYRLIFAAQAMKMSAIVRLADRSGNDVQRVLDAGADGIMVPRVREPAEAARLGTDAIFSPQGQRGLGSTSRAGRWGLIPLSDYLLKGREATLRMIQLEDLPALERVEEFVAVPEINGLFLGLGDLFLSSGLPPTHPTVQALVARALAAAQRRGIPCGIAVGTAEEAARYREMGFPIIMISNDCTLFGRAAAQLVRTARGPTSP